MKNLMTILFFIFILAGILTAGDNAKYVIKFATVAPEGSAWMNVMRDYDSALQKATNGEMKFKIYAGGVGGDEKAVIRKIRFNQYQSAGFTGVGLGEILPEVRIFDSPMLFRDYAEVDYAFSKFTEEFERKFEENGYVLLGWTEVGFVYVFSKSPLNNHESLKGSKMWTWEGDPVASATFSALHVTPVPLALQDVLTSLQTNLIDAAYTAPSACVALQWYTKVNYVTNLKLADALGAVLISKKTFDNLPGNYQLILKELGHKYMRELTEISRKDNEESLKLILESGIKTVEVDEAELPFFIQAGKDARQSMAGSVYSQELLNRLEKAITEFRNQSK